MAETKRCPVYKPAPGSGLSLAKAEKYGPVLSRMGRGVAATDAHIVWLKQQITVLEHTLTAMGIEEEAT